MSDKKISELTPAINLQPGDLTIIARNNQNYSIDLNILTGSTIDLTPYYTSAQTNAYYLSANTFSNTINTNGINNTGNISATTYYGNGSNLTNIPNTFTTGATLSGYTAIFSRNDGFNYSLDLSALTVNNLIICSTYQELLDLYIVSELIPGQYYCITDFATVCNVLDQTDISHGIHTGDTEPIIILATGVQNIHPQVYSIDFPEDIIYWTGGAGNGNDIGFRDEFGDPIAGFKGSIYYRKDTINNIECCYDWRNVEFYHNGFFVNTFNTMLTTFDVSIGKRYDKTILNNIIFLGTVNNVKIGANNSNNVIGDKFAYNVIGTDFQNNVVGTNFMHNTIGNIFSTNTIGNQFKNNIIDYNFNSNSIGNSFNNNNIGNDFESNVVGTDFKYNYIKSSPNSINFTAATHVYGNYNCEIFKNSGGDLRLKYIDGSDNDVITEITA